MVSGCGEWDGRARALPAAYSFRDLHVAIQDAMGWLDYHLHEFRFRGVGQEDALLLFLDGAYVYRDNRSPRFRRVRAPDKGELEDLVQLIN